MKRHLVGTRLAFLVLGVGWLTALMFVLWVGMPGTANANRLGSNLLAPSPTALSPVHCTNTLTTTPDLLVGAGEATSFDIAAPLGGPYNDLALARTYISQNLSVDVYPEYFLLNTPVIGAQYKIEAIPQSGGNYYLGMTVFYNDYTVYTSDSNPSDPKASITFVATPTVPYYYVMVYQLPSSCRAGYYDLTFQVTNPTATPPGPTSTPTNTPAPGSARDYYDTPPRSNGTITDALVWAVLGQNNITGLTLCNQASCDPSIPSSDEDWYVIYAVQGYHYIVNAAPDGAYPVLNMQVFRPDRTTLVGGVGNSNNPSISWDANVAGNYFVHIWRAAGSLTNGSYHLTWNAPGPTATGTPGPEVTDTPVPGLDAFEPNYDFDHAASIGLNVKYTGINFVPLPGQDANNDYFQVRVKRGMLVTCETLDLSPGTDTNMILYDNDRNGLAGNDDVDTSRGELRSRVTVSINYDGFLYILVGQGYAVPNFQASQYNYSILCTTPGNSIVTPTDTPVSGGGSANTPVPSATPLPSATTPATPMPPISVRTLPTPTPAGPARQMVTADLRVYYDANQNGVADPGEGVVGLPVRVYDDVTGALLAQGFTDDSGHAVFTVPSAGPIRVIVPYLDFQTIVPPSGAAIPVLISPRELPSQIP